MYKKYYQIHYYYRVFIIFVVSLFSLRCLKAANSIAPPAPNAAAGVGLVIPPSIEPSTATIKINGGNTTRNNSLLDKLKIANLKP